MCNYSRHDTLSARTWDTDHWSWHVLTWILSSFQHYLHQWMHASLVFVVLFFFFARNHSLVFVDNFELVFHLINVNQGFVTANIFRSLVICIWIHFGVEYVTSKRKNLHNCLLLIITNPLPVLAKSQFVRHTAYQFQMSKFLSYLLLFLFISAWRLENTPADSRNDWVCPLWRSLSVEHCKLFGIRAPFKRLWYVICSNFEVLCPYFHFNSPLCHLVY
jgi:hypothetical protein